MFSNGERLRSSGKCAATGTNKGRDGAGSLHKNCFRYFCTGNKGDQAVLGRVERISRRSQPSACNAWHAIVQLGTTPLRRLFSQESPNKILSVTRKMSRGRVPSAVARSARHSL